MGIEVLVGSGVDIPSSTDWGGRGACRGAERNPRLGGRPPQRPLEQRGLNFDPGHCGRLLGLPAVPESRVEFLVVVVVLRRRRGKFVQSFGGSRV